MKRETVLTSSLIPPPSSLLVWALDGAQLGHRVAYASGQLFDSLDAAAGGLAQLFAQEQLGLADDARQRVVDFVAHVRHQVSDLRQPRLARGDQGAQALVLPVAGRVARLLGAHLCSPVPSGSPPQERTPPGKVGRAARDV